MPRPQCVDTSTDPNTAIYLPFELWSFIFCQLPKNSLIELMHVSQTWRDIVKRTPQLWTHLHMCHPHQFADSAGLSQWLKKSGDLPLDVVIKVPLEATELQPTLALLHDHVKRFRALDIDVPVPDVADTILSSLGLSGGISNGNPSPLLGELRIAIDEDPDPYYQVHPYFENIFHPVPQLRRLTVSALRLPQPSSKLLSTVTTLVITAGPEDQAPYVDDMLDTIAAIPHLKCLRYTGPEVFSYQATGSLEYPHIVSLPHLEVLDVTVPGCGLDIFQCLAAPTLRSLRLDGWREEEYAEEWDDLGSSNVSPSLKSRLSQRAPSIQRLDLHCLEYLQPDTYSWLFNQTDLSHLEDLRIESSTITDTAFTQSSSDGLSLRRLEIRGCKHITGSALIAYIEAKKLSRPEEFKLLVSGCPGIGDKDLARLSCLVSVEDVDD